MSARARCRAHRGRAGWQWRGHSRPARLPSRGCRAHGTPAPPTRRDVAPECGWSWRPARMQASRCQASGRLATCMIRFETLVARAWLGGRRVGTPNLPHSPAEAVGMSKSKRTGLRSHSAILKGTGAVLSVAALIAAWFLLPVEDWIETFQRRIEGLGAWGLVAFGVVYVAATVLLVPGSVLTLAAGLAFGLARGFAIVVVSATIGATLAFLIARYLVHDRVESFVAGRPKFKAVK